MKEPIIILSNPECLRILTEVGIVDKLFPEPPYTRAHAFFEKDDCHCVASYDKGHRDEKDNGYCIIMIPYAMMPMWQAHSLLDDVMKRSALSDDGVCRFVNLGKDLQ